MMEKIFNNNYILPNHFYPINKLKNYLNMGIVRNYQKGDSVVSPGEIIDSVIYVISGKLGITFLTEDGKRRLMFHADAGTFTDRLFQPDDCLVDVVSEEESVVCYFSKDKLLEMFQQDKEVLCEFITSYASKCGYFMHEAKEMALYNPSVRVLRLLYKLCLTKGELVNNVYEINIKLSQKAISEMTGVHYVTVCKIFQNLREKNILRKTSNRIIIFDLKRLKDLISN
ncbi:Crp/Fnr family transcriptional regulator [Dehalobacter sp. 14DCB1]|uniref:Crp/Fnr family transcriptional regulator n=1 Tax=Dehalobacter sp. 14DCB1 TaxID=2070227 RepID=UPI0032B7B323